MVRIQMHLPHPAGKRKSIRTPAASAASAASATSATSASDRSYVLPFLIRYDHRERSGGWQFSGMLAPSHKQYRPLIVCKREVHMMTGDYTIESSDLQTELPIIIERKSHDDVIGSLGGGHERLKAEHERMAEFIASHPAGQDASGNPRPRIAHRAGEDRRADRPHPVPPAAAEPGGPRSAARSP